MIARTFLVFSLLLALGACRQALVVVQPSEDGSVGAVTLDDGRNPVTLDKAGAAAEIRSGRGSAARVEQNEITNIFALAFAARPILPRRFEFFFASDSNKLTRESAATYPALYADLKRRTVYEVAIVGHADTLGDESYDQNLSLKRAATMRDQLVEDGFDPRAITVEGRGYHELLVPTPPETSEPRNRWVEVTVR